MVLTSRSTARPLEPLPGGRLAALAARLHGWRPGLPSLAWLGGAAVGLLGVLLALGWVLARVANDGALGRFDAGMARSLAGDRTDGLTTLTGAVTLLAETITVIVIGTVAFLVARFAFRRWREPLLILAAVLGEVLIFLAVTLLVDRERPPVPKLDEAPPTSSFPSGHTAASVALYGSLAVIAWHHLRRRGARVAVAVVLGLIPVLVAAARVYRGMHYLTDVLGGILLGSVWLAAAVAAIQLGVAHSRVSDKGSTR